MVMETYLILATDRTYLEIRNRFCSKGLRSVDRPRPAWRDWGPVSP